MWKRFRSKTGLTYYQANISDTIILQIWKENTKWNWVIIGWPNPTDKEPGPLILRHGICKTLGEAKTQIKLILPKQEEQMVWTNV